jgi:SOUL heme-binding protein
MATLGCKDEGMEGLAGEDWVLARYNDPSIQPIFRRNEVLVPVAKFDLWANNFPE